MINRKIFCKSGSRTAPVWFSRFSTAHGCDQHTHRPQNIIGRRVFPLCACVTPTNFRNSSNSSSQGRSNLVSSRLDYANSVLFGATQKNISKLQKAQNLLARVVVGWRRGVVVSGVRQ